MDQATLGSSIVGRDANREDACSRHTYTQHDSFERNAAAMAVSPVPAPLQVYVRDCGNVLKGTSWANTLPATAPNQQQASQPTDPARPALPSSSPPPQSAPLPVRTCCRGDADDAPAAPCCNHGLRHHPCAGHHCRQVHVQRPLQLLRGARGVQEVTTLTDAGAQQRGVDGAKPAGGGRVTTCMRVCTCVREQGGVQRSWRLHPSGARTAGLSTRRGAVGAPVMDAGVSCLQGVGPSRSCAPVSRAGSHPLEGLA